MKKLLLLGLMMLIAATAVSAQYGSEWEWQSRVTKVYQCNYGPYNKANWLPYNGLSYECLDVRGKLDPYDPVLGYLLNQKYVQSVNAIDLTNRIFVCGYKWLLAPDYKTEWSVEYWTFETCPAGYTKIDLGLYSLKQQAPGTSEVFLCRNTGDRPINYMSKDPNCRRPGYIKVASLGFWPQNQDFTLQPPAPTPTPAQPVIAPPVTLEEDICCLITQERDGQKRIEIEKSTKTRCEEQAKREENVVETKIIPMEQCRQKICCEQKDDRHSMEYRECLKEQGKIVEISLEQCKVEKPPVVQALTVPAVDCAAIIKENEQLRKQRDELIKKRDELKSRLKPQPKNPIYLCWSTSYGYQNHYPNIGPCAGGADARPDQRFGKPGELSQFGNLVGYLSPTINTATEETIQINECVRSVRRHHGTTRAYTVRDNFLYPVACPPDSETVRVLGYAYANVIPDYTKEVKPCRGEKDESSFDTAFSKYDCYDYSTQTFWPVLDGKSLGHWAQSAKPST